MIPTCMVTLGYSVTSGLPLIFILFLNLSLIFCIFLKIYLFIWKTGREREREKVRVREREREPERFYLLVHFPKMAATARGWDRLNPGASISLFVSHTSVRAQALGSSSATFSGALAGMLQMKKSSWDFNQHSDMGYWHCKRVFNSLCHNVSPLSPDIFSPI